MNSKPNPDILVPLEQEGKTLQGLKRENNSVLEKIITHYNLQRMPVEGTYISRKYKSSYTLESGLPVSTAIIGLYSDELESISCFHRLTYDEVWHFYDGDPLVLYLLYADGTSEEVIMGKNFEKGQKIQYVVPANVWQAGCIFPGGLYSLYGCTVAPGFTGVCFEAGLEADLIKQYPDREGIIKKLSVNGVVTHMPDGYAE